MSEANEWVFRCIATIPSYHGKCLNDWIVQALSMVWCFYFIHIEIFFMTDTFQRSEAIWVKKRRHKSIPWRDIFSLCWQLYISFLLFVYTLIFWRRDFNFKRETKIINIFKIHFINGIANLLMLTIMKYMKPCQENGTNSVLKITNAKMSFQKIKIW